MLTVQSDTPLVVGTFSWGDMNKQGTGDRLKKQFHSSPASQTIKFIGATCRGLGDGLMTGI